MEDLGLHLADEGPQEGRGEGRLEVGVEARVPLEGVEGAGDVVAEQDAAAQDVLQDGTCGIQCSVLTHVGSLPLRATVSVLTGVLAMNPEPNKFYSCMLHSSCPEGRDFRVQVDRSEEHTSELQSRGHLVCRLLLANKKNKKVREHNALIRY